MNSRMLKEYLNSQIGDSLEMENIEDKLKAYFKKAALTYNNVSDVRFFLKECLLEVSAQAEKKYPYMNQYIPAIFYEPAEGDIEYVVQDFTERIMRLNRLIQCVNPSKNDKIRLICKYISENVEDEINLDALAKVMFMNKKYLSTFIKSNLGISFTRYVRKIKIEHAKKLLCDTELRIYEISEILHFKDVEYFSRIFKIETGRCPSDYVWFPNDDLSAEVQKNGIAAEYIKIGIIGAYSGEYGYLEQGKKRIYQYTAEEINRQGGICGRKVELCFADYESDISLVESKMQSLIDENIDVVIGGFLSSAREIIRPIIDRNKILYIYDSLYEGGIADHYTFCVSSMPEQNLFPAIKYMLQQGKKKFYVLATDYNYGILSCECAKHYITENGGDLIATEYVPNQKEKFAVTIENIMEFQPDVIITFLVGEKQSVFFEQWKAFGDKSIPIITTSAISQGYMHITTQRGSMENVFFSAPYSEGMEKKETDTWSREIRKQFDYNQIPYLGSDHEAAYLAIHLYKRAVEMCNSTDVENVVNALEYGQIKIDAPGGYANLNPQDHHLIRDVGIFRVDEKNKIQTVKIIPQIKSEFVETILQQKFNVREGLKELGRKAPNIQYNMMLYKL